MTATSETRAANDRLGEVTGPREVTFVRLLPGPIDRIWAFLVEPEKRARWFAGGELEPRVGGAFTLLFHNGELTAAGETVPERFAAQAGEIVSHGVVTAFEPPRRFAFDWGEPCGQNSEVVFELETAEGGKVRLTLVHRRLADRREMLDVSGGWHSHLGVLEDALNDRAPKRFWSAIDEVEPLYDQILPRD